MKELPLGKSNFKKLIEDNCYYVDKTNLIEELLDTKAKVVLFTRPRRFGKSLFLSMLDNFLNIETKKENKNLFKNLYISKSKYYKEMGKYPVIHIDFKDIKKSNFDECYDKFKSTISELYIKKIYVKKCLYDVEKEKYDRVISGSASKVEYEDSIRTLSMWLERYYNEKTIILIDEYDVPIQEGYLNDYYDEIINLMKSVFSSSLKSNDSLKMGILTGVLRVSKESMFSDLNNPRVITMMSSKYNEAFGFTERETKELLEYYGLKLTKEVKGYYDGYNFGGLGIYNPWSILNYADEKKLIPYWINTSGNVLIKDLIRNLKEVDKKELIEVIDGKTISFDFDEKITYIDFKEYQDMNKVYNLLFASGYLTFDKRIDDADYFRVPNKEVKDSLNKIFQEAILNITLGVTTTRNFIENILNGEKEKIEEFINDTLDRISYYDLNSNLKEINYHLIMIGMLSTVNESKYIVKSNRESGLGRLDIMIESTDRTKDAIIELKVANSKKEMEEKIKEGSIQIEDKEYIRELKLDKIKNIEKHVIVFYKKSCIVK